MTNLTNSIYVYLSLEKWKPKSSIICYNTDIETVKCIMSKKNIGLIIYASLDPFKLSVIEKIYGVKTIKTSLLRIIEQQLSADILIINGKLRYGIENCATSIVYQIENNSIKKFTIEGE